MTQAFNLSQLANGVNTTGQLNASTYLFNQVPVANGGTGLSTLTAGYIPYGAGTSAFGSSNSFVWDTANLRLGIGTATPAVKLSVVGTDAVLIPVGTTAQRPTGASGYLRFNSTTTQFEGFNGTAWSSVGGAAITNDTTTASDLYPTFVNATTGTALTIFTSNAKLLYRPSTGEFTSSIIEASNGIIVNSQTISVSYAIPAGNSAMSAGNITIATGITVTLPTGSRWVIV
jgi:hypothetical protein